MDHTTSSYILANYDQCSTEISIEGDTVCQLDVLRGVKQGDPMSPVLFNILMDELVSKLNKMPGAMFGTENISCFAYADDLVLVADSARAANNLLAEAISFFDDRGLELNIRKCSALSTRVVPSKKKVCTWDRPLFRIKGLHIRALSVGETFKIWAINSPMME